MIQEFTLKAPDWKKKNSKGIYAIKKTFISLNDYTNFARINPYMSNKIKKDMEMSYIRQIRSLRLHKVDYPVHLHYHIVLSNVRRDLDNISSIVSKYTLDSLVHAEILPTDSLKIVRGLSFSVEVDKKIGREVVKIRMQPIESYPAVNSKVIESIC